MAALITQAEYARRRGVSREAVRKALGTARISGVLHAGKVMIDPDAADLAWARNTDSDQQQRGAPEQLELTQQRAQAVATHQSDADPAPSAGVATSSPHLVRAKTDTELLRKELLELELAEKRGELVPIVDIERAYAAKLAAARDALESIPDRIGPNLAATTDVAACVRMVADEIRIAMRHLVGQEPELVN